MLTRRTLYSHKKGLSGSAIKTTASFAPRTKVTYTKKPQAIGNEANDITNNHAAFRNTISSRRKRRRMSLLSGNNNQRTISGIQPTVLRSLHSHSMFQKLASHAESTVRCAYRRTIYPYEDSCFLCLQEYTEKLICTNHCHAKVHTECTKALTTLISLLTYDHSLECVQLVPL